MNTDSNSTMNNIFVNGGANLLTKTILNLHFASKQMSFTIKNSVFCNFIFDLYAVGVNWI